MSQSSATAKVQWWIFGLLLLVHVACNISTDWILSTLAKLQNIAVYESSTETLLFSGWPFRCYDFDSTGKCHYLVTQTVVNIFIAMFSSYASAVCVANAYGKCHWRFHRGVVFAFAGTLLSLIYFHFRSHVRFDQPSEWPWFWQLEKMIVIFVSNLSDRVAWLSAILGLYWPLSNLGSLAKRYLNLRDGQFNLSMVLIGVTAASILFAFAGRQFRSQRAQQKAVGYFQSRECFFYNEEFFYESGYWEEIAPLPGKTWRDWEAGTGASRYLLASRDGLYRVVFIGIGYSARESEVDWSNLRSLPYLQMIEVSGRSQDNGEMFAELANCRHLVCICASDCDIHDDDLKVLTSDSKLKRLHLYDAPITDKSVGYLLRPKNLRALDIRGTKISKEGVQQLKEGLPSCKVEYSDWQDHEVIEDPFGN